MWKQTSKSVIANTFSDVPIFCWQYYIQKDFLRLQCLLWPPVIYQSWYPSCYTVRYGHFDILTSSLNWWHLFPDKFHLLPVEEDSTLPKARKSCFMFNTTTRQVNLWTLKISSQKMLKVLIKMDLMDKNA